jgi:hypothetical protein
VTRSPLVEAAGDYLSRGLSVIALAGKTPNPKVHRHGLHQPLSGAPDPHGDHPMDGYVGAYDGCPGCDDLKVIRGAFEHPETTGIGILTSYPLIVADLDSEEGAQSWLSLVGEDQLMAATWVARTRKGLHLYYASIHKTGTFKLFGAAGGVDLKGDGGYVAAPPSAHPDGGEYTWINPPGDTFPEAPGELLALIVEHATDVERAVAQAGYKRAVYRARNEEYGSAPDFKGLLKKVAEAEEGNRNAMLHWAARSMADEGGEDADFASLSELAREIGLTPVEIKRTIRSARRG